MARRPLTLPGAFAATATTCSLRTGSVVAADATFTETATFPPPPSASR